MASNTLLQLVEGWTAAIDFQLYLNGSALDGTGFTVAMVLRDRHDDVVMFGGSVAWLSQSAGTVRYLPVNTDLTQALSPYSVRFQVTDGSGKVAYFPDSDPLEFHVSIT